MTAQSRPRVRALTLYSSKGERPCQEDYVLGSQEKGIFVVADGFGGPVAGLGAAKTACEAVRGFLEKEAGDLEATLPFVLRSYFSLAGNVLFNALIHANRKVRALNKDRNVHEKGGASVVAGFVDGYLLALANVGACGAQLLRSGECAPLVVPRTYGLLSDPFLERKKDAAPPAHHQIPLIALGMTDDLEPEIFEYRIRPGDWLLLHTDGAGTGVIEALRSIQLKRLKIQDSAQEAQAALREKSGPDNMAISLVIF